jgi:hypothetical protein
MRTVGQAIIIPKVHHFIKPGTLLLALTVVACDTVVAEDSHPPRQFWVVSSDHPSFTCGNVLDRMKAKSVQLGQRTDR